MKEAIHVYYRAGVVHFKELKPQRCLRVYHPSVHSLVRLNSWLTLNEDKIYSRTKSLGGEVFVIERRER